MSFIHDEIKAAEERLAAAKAKLAEREADIDLRAFEMVKTKHPDLFEQLRKAAKAEFDKSDRDREAKRKAAVQKRKDSLAAKGQPEQATTPPQQQPGFGHQG